MSRSKNFFRNRSILLVSLCLIGCTALHKEPPPAATSTPTAAAQPVRVSADIPVISSELKNIEEERMQDYAKKYGVVFGKTDFEGILKTSYVKLLFEDVLDENNKFQLLIGKQSNQSVVWDVNTVEPEYFFIELPAGKYRIGSVSIPVGSTMATESTAITFDVTADAITYIGTLKMVGTKEKVKLGGVPVLQPGFEYHVEIIDEGEDGKAVFKQRYPNTKSEILFKLMEHHAI